MSIVTPRSPTPRARRSPTTPRLRGGHAFSVVLAFILAISACSGGDSGDRWAGTELDSAGVHLVHNPDGGIWGDGEAWTFQEELDLGTLEGAPELQFGQITALDVDAGGNLYVGDSQAREIRVFGSDGTYLRTVGAPGSGPGELGQSIAAVFADSGGALRAVDVMNQRVNAYAPDGSPSGSFPLDFRGGIPVRWAQLPSGQLVAQLRGMQIPGMDAHEEGDPLVVFSSEGAVVDTLHHLPRGKMMELSGGGMPKITLFETEPIWALSPEGTLLTAVNTDYRVAVRNADATVRLVLTKAFVARPVEEADQRAFRRLLRETMSNQGQPPRIVEMMMENISFADTYPAFGNLLAGPGGTVWVQRIITASDVRGDEDVEIDPQDLGSPDWDVFDSDGRFLGTVTLPRRFTPMKVVDDAIYGIRLDDLDVQHVLRLRVMGASPPVT